MRIGCSQIVAAFLAAQVAGSATAEDMRENHVHEHFAKDVDAFHAVLAPLWHGQPGPARTQEACSKAKQLGSLAKGIGTGDTKALVAATSALEQQCLLGQDQVDAALADVHEAFHRLAEGQ